MVYMSGSKMARNAASIVNKPTCGGPKKSGLAPSVGIFIDSNVQLRGAQNTQWIGGLPPVCIPNRTIQTQLYGYRATHNPI
jgi:hypothetical protein